MLNSLSVNLTYIRVVGFQKLINFVISIKLFKVLWPGEPVGSSTKEFHCRNGYNI